MKHPKLDWKRELDKKELKYGVLILLLYLAAIIMASSGCSNRALVQGAHEAGKGRQSPAAAQKPLTPVRASGRQLTIAKHAQKQVTSRHFQDQVYGVSIDFPRNYDLHEGDLPDMDRGLGYLGEIPMEFPAEGGVRLATVEFPSGAHPGTDFVNAFVTVSVLPNTTEAACSGFRPAREKDGPSRTRVIDGIEFHVKEENTAANIHQFSGVYLHGYSEESCYEIGYGVATAGYGAVDGIRKVNSAAVQQKLETIVNSISINAPTGKESF